MNTSKNLLALACSAVLSISMATAQAQHAGHHHAPPSTPTTDHDACTAEHAAMGHCTPVTTSKPETANDTCTAEHAAMGHCTPAITHQPNASDDTCTAEHAAMGHCTPAAVPAPATSSDTCTAEHAAMGHCTPAAASGAATGDDACTPEHAAMGHCTPARRGLIEPREPIPPVTDADRAAAFPPLQHGHDHGPTSYARTRFNRLEAWDADPGTGQAWEASASYGGDIHRLWLRSEGERVASHTESADLEVLYGRGISPWWDIVAGAKHDFGPGDSQTWAAVGLQGLAPYFFEFSATAYLGESGKLAAAVEIEYDMLITNRLILQPLIELQLNSKNDPERGVGRGLSSAEAGLRLRYEITRRFAPYIGISHHRSFGNTADLHRAAGDDTSDTVAVAGVRAWF